MFKPVTSIAESFNQQCLHLDESLKESEGVLAKSNKSDKVSRAIQVFFDAIQRIPGQIVSNENRATVLFEIDCSLQGLYGCTVFLSNDDATPTRKLLRDLASLWQRYYLIAGLERGETLSGPVAATMAFYHEWARLEGIGKEKTEYDCLGSDCALIIQRKDKLNIDAKILLLSLMGKILITLGVTDEFAQNQLQKKSEAIRRREKPDLDLVLPEVLLCLQVLRSSDKGIESAGLDQSALSRAMRYWCSNDDFLDALFKQWGWHAQYDFISPLKMGDQLLHLKERSALFNSYMNGSAKLGIGHSYFELVEHKKKNPGLTTVFQPVPIFMFGHSGVGKTSYLTAFSYDIQMRSGKTIALGRESQVLYELHQQAWRKNDLAPTTTIQAHNFWQDLNVTGFQTHDYGGKDTQPDQWEQQLQEAFRNARGLFFMIEASDCADSARLRAKANWFDAILQYWMQANPALRHVPVGIIITKSDLLFGDELAALTRTSLLPLAFEQVLVETPLQHRFPHATQDVQSPIGRLRHLILCDRLNNVHPILQDIAEGMLDNFSQFLSRILGITYNYQIFLTSSLPPRVANDSMHPWGIREPMFWMLKILEKYHLSESKHKFEEEEKQVADQIRVVQEDIAQLRALQHETTSSNDEIARIHNKPTIFVEVMKQRLKFHEERRQRAEQEFFSIVQRYVPGAPQSNKALALQMVEREVKTKEKFLGEIRSKRTDFERRLKEHQIER